MSVLLFASVNADYQSPMETSFSGSSFSFDNSRQTNSAVTNNAGPFGYLWNSFCEGEKNREIPFIVSYKLFCTYLLFFCLRSSLNWFVLMRKPKKNNNLVRKKQRNLFFVSYKVFCTFLLFFCLCSCLDGFVGMRKPQKNHN